MDNETQVPVVISVSEGILLGVTLQAVFPGWEGMECRSLHCDSLAWPLTLTDVGPAAPAQHRAIDKQSIHLILTELSVGSHFLIWVGQVSFYQSLPPSLSSPVV